MAFTEGQQEILEEADFVFRSASEVEVCDIAAGIKQVSELDEETLLELLQVLNLLYRGGEPLVDDASYDFIYLAELKARNPKHPFLRTVEPEPTIAAKTVELPVRMLSTEKAYDFESIARWAKRIEKAAAECGVDFTTLTFRATPKLDGYAAYDDGSFLYTRGDGRRGTDITRAFDRGLQVVNGEERGLGPGEIVVSKSYFVENLSEHFDNSRNFQASLIKEKELEEPAAEAVRRGEAVFYPFSCLPDWKGSWAELSTDFDPIIEELWSTVDYDIDGIVLEIDDNQVKLHMGATRHHHRWQIAYKKNTDTADVRVLQVIAQTSRSGRVNPVAEIEPTRLSGALIRRATGHHYKMVRDTGVGPGALIRLSRSGEVIPKIEDVLEPAVPQLPELCPSCDTRLIWENDYLVCINSMYCPAQITHTIGHFFKTLGNIDGFGPSSIRKIFDSGVGTLPEIYGLKEADFVAMGFGPKQAENMVAQLKRSLSEPIEDWRFLAAFGVYRMGMGNCEKLLEVYPLEQILELKREQITAIKGFSEKIADAMLSGLHSVSTLFNTIYKLEFNLIRTGQPVAADPTGPLVGKILVFTGTMQGGTRDEMKKQAKVLGAVVGSSITGKTDMLVCGEKVGAAKLKKAESLGVQVLSEAEYRTMLE